MNRPAQNAETQQVLLAFAKNECLQHLLTHPQIGPWADRIAFVLVGSVATGLCRAGSDVDVALLCDADVYNQRSPGTLWARGRPTEAMVDGTQLHYYGITLAEVATKIAEHDDVCLYVYGHTVVLKDSQAGHAKRLARLMGDAQDLRQQRAERKLDMLMRRSRALRAVLADGDPITVAEVFLEVIRLLVKVVALLDGVPFDPRKRLFGTALAGPLGTRLCPQVTALLGQLSLLGRPDDLPHSGTQLIEDIDAVAGTLADIAASQGFRVGLDRPDRRHAER